MGFYFMVICVLCENNLYYGVTIKITIIIQHIQSCGHYIVVNKY
jgi:hypothetical protein